MDTKNQIGIDLGSQYDPVYLTKEQQELCYYLDEINIRSVFVKNKKPSELILGALFATNDQNQKNNPDWIAQSAHSFREILYGYLPKDLNDKKASVEKIVANTNGTYDATAITENILNFYTVFTNISHHTYDGDNLSSRRLKELEKIGIADLAKDTGEIVFNKELYLKIIQAFFELLKHLYISQISRFDEIDNIITKNLSEVSVLKLKNLIINFNARNYFFQHAPASWIIWFLENGFFETLNREVEDKTRYSYSKPELAYLANVVGSQTYIQDTVVVIRSVECDKNFNPEVIDRFVWMISEMPAENIAELVPKMKKENWIQLMFDFNPSGYQYQKIVEKLAEAKESQSLLLMAEFLLTTKTDRDESIYFDRYFVLSDVYSTSIFKALAEVEENNLNNALRLVARIFRTLTQDWEGESDGSFEKKDKFFLYDIDLFNINDAELVRGSGTDDIRSLMETFIVLIRRTIGSKSTVDPSSIYEKYIETLPDTSMMFRIKLFAMSLCPELFREKLQKSFDRLFSAMEDRYYNDIDSGAEYRKALEISFDVFDETYQRQFIKKIFKNFVIENEDEREVRLYKRSGLRLLNSIGKYLIDEEKDKCLREFGLAYNDESIDTPGTPIGKVRGGYVSDRSPVTFEEEKYSDVAVIMQDLKTILAPEILKEDDRLGDFLNPQNAEGVGNALKENMKKRMGVYIAQAENFVGDNLHTHYAYSFIYGVIEYLRDGKKLEKKDWDNLFILFEKIRTLKKIDPEQIDNRWLAKWTWIEKAMADVLQFFLSENYSSLFEEKRQKTLELIAYLHNSSDPESEHETGEYGDLYTVAINSTRGRNFEVLVNFVYSDGKELKPDVLKLYKQIVSTASLSVRFVIGRYISSFYFRDKKEVRKVFSSIFSLDRAKREEFFAAWEGYLTSALYEELFDELQVYYTYALAIQSSEYPERKRNRDMDEAVGTNLAVAFVHFDSVQFSQNQKHPLIKMLFENGDKNKQKEFISFIGRGVISRDVASEEYFKANNISIKKLMDLWEFLLRQDILDSDVFSAFGFWINRKEDIFEYSWLVKKMAETLTRSNGKLDREYELLQRLSKFVQVDPASTFIIVEKYLIGGLLAGDERKMFMVDDNMREVFAELYKYDSESTVELTNKLLTHPNGGKVFWGLRKIVE